MANHYTQFSEVIAELTAEDEAWVEAAIERAEEGGEPGWEEFEGWLGFDYDLGALLPRMPKGGGACSLTL